MPSNSYVPHERNFNSDLKPSLKFYGHLLSNSSIDLSVNQEVICDRDSWVFLWNELTRRLADRDQCLGLATSQFLQSITFKKLPVLFLTPIPLSASELMLANFGLNVESYEISVPMSRGRYQVKFFYKYPWFGWKKKAMFEIGDLSKPWVELEFSSKRELMRFISFYNVVSIRDWRIIVSKWSWTLPLLAGLFRSLWLDFRFRRIFR